MSLKKTVSICASALMLLSITPSVSASNVKPVKQSMRISRHTKNVERANRIKSLHNRNVSRIQRIKRHLINHQKNLVKISKRINRARNHRGHTYHVALLNRLNADKARLINAIQYNERGMLRLARTVANEEHQINLIRHPRNPQPPALKGHTVQSPKVNLNQDSSIERSVTTEINEVNGKLTKYVAKDSSSKRNGNQFSYRQYSDANGNYSATPNQINQDEISQLNQQIADQIQNSNQWLNRMNSDFNSWL